MSRAGILLVFLFVIVANLYADNFISRTYSDPGGKTFPYEIQIPPGYDKTKQYPVALFFHGTGEQGTDILNQMGVGAIYHSAPDWSVKFPTFVIFAEGSADEQVAHKILDSAASEFSIDKNRLYTQGLPFVARTYTDPGGKTLPYELMIPSGYDATKKYPVILFFHGAGEVGADNFAQLRNGAIKYGSPDFQAKNPCFVIVPQCPDGDKWVDMNWGAPSSVRPPQPTSAMQLALKILDGVTSEFNIDKNRTYVLGLSMGGYAVWDCVTRYPDRFAAGIVWCGGGDENTVTAAVARVPVWAFHSSDDPIVPVIRDRNMVAAMTKMGGHPRYTEFNGLGHYAWNKAFDEPQLFPWLFQQQLDQRPPVGK